MKHLTDHYNERLFYIQTYASSVSKDPELFTWEDAREIIRHYQTKYPEQRFQVREFELI
jgi:hypothetical protein